MNLVDPGTLKTFLARHGVSASKGLGQHFLCSRPAVRLIVEAAKPSRGILEIGPGPGVLTAPLSESAERLIALELDPRMVSALGESAPLAEVRQVDALKADLASILHELPTPRAVVSNMPYYITGPLVTAIAGAKAGWSIAVLMMQLEVASRIMAPPGNRNRGSISVFLQSQFQITIVANVPAVAFVPPPKVESTVLRLTPLDVDYPDAFYRVVRLAFAQPRKTLANNLSAGLRIPREQALAAIEGVSLSEWARPHDLDIEHWKALYRALGNV